LHRGPLEQHYLCTKCHENLPSGSEVISGEQTDKTGVLTRLLSFLESRLKIEKMYIIETKTKTHMGEENKHTKLNPKHPPK
jgi:hypothetical protein